MPHLSKLYIMLGLVGTARVVWNITCYRRLTKCDTLCSQLISAANWIPISFQVLCGPSRVHLRAFEQHALVQREPNEGFIQ